MILVHRFTFLLLLLFGMASTAVAQHVQNLQDFGTHSVHYSTFTTDVLPPKMARYYRIPRSKSRGLLNITVLKNEADAQNKAVPAKVEVKATNLTGQIKHIDIREIKEGPAIYYIGDFHVTHREMLDFDIEVTVEGSKETYPVKFRRQFFTH